MSFELIYERSWPDINCPHCGTGFRVEFEDPDVLKKARTCSYNVQCLECGKLFKYVAKLVFLQDDNPRIQMLCINRAFNRTERERLVGAIETAIYDAEHIIKAFKRRDIEEGTVGQQEALKVLIEEYEKLKEKLR